MTAKVTVTAVRYAYNARCERWGSEWGARRVSGLTDEQKALVRSGVELRMTDCPPARGNRGGTTERVIVVKGRHFYARVPRDGGES